MGGDLLNRSKEQKQQADKLLADSKLIEQLKQFGDIGYSGSYAYDLMLNPDIDLHLILDDYKKHTASKVLNTLIEQGWWNSYTFADWTQDKFRLPQWQWLPRGYYINVRADFGGARWKVDIWLLDKARYKGDYLAEKMSKVTDDERLAILQIKEARESKRVNSGSYDIYTAVIDDGIKTPEEFTRWQSSR
jgi:hypothetical protein